MKLDNKAEARRVKKGAAFMDRILPGWHRRVNLKQLYMGHAAMCLLGQTFGVHNEESLAKEMYPEEFKESLVEAFSWHRDAARPKYFSSFGFNIGLRAIPKIMKKLGMKGIGRNPEVDYPDFANLYAVCRGHDNKCYWAEEIAQRLVSDAEAK